MQTSKSAKFFCLYTDSNCSPWIKRRLPCPVYLHTNLSAMQPHNLLSYSACLLDVGLKDHWKIQNGRSPLFMVNCEFRTRYSWLYPVFKISKDRDYLNSLSKLVHSSSFHGKIFFSLHLVWTSVISSYVHAILSPRTSLKNHSWCPPCRFWHSCCPWNYVFSRLSKPSSFCDSKLNFCE